MIALDSTTIKLECILAGAIATSQPECHVWFYDVLAQTKEGNEDYKRSAYRSAANSANDVTICPAPTSNGVSRHIESIAFHNKDTASVTVTIKTDDGTTERTILKKTLTTLQTLIYESNAGWTVI